MSNWWNLSKVEAWNFTIKTFKSCQFNESRLFICRLKSEHNRLGENARNIARFMADASKINSIKNI